ncbi:MobV family relaxase [Clostridium tarantellae]|uniref:Plasmid recombination protein n=1 Tax=Clostridium tarantellae TaxID=39493 RepID=A0A6I1MMD4_9CLOT|nr:MobV family relaxase [Clostridium tarantellae]MPQ44545.1 hypothetical protein [Clostridium tarantellae]
MSYCVCRFQKYTRGNVFGLQKHNQRENKNYANKDITLHRTKENFDISNFEKINYLKTIDNIIEENRKSNRAVRKDAIVYVESIITSDREFFKSLSKSEIINFFSESCNFLCDKVGIHNVIASNVHFDETTPHMHFSFVPITSDGSLSAKKLINRQFLRMIQDELPKHLKSLGFNIERGVKGSKEKYLKVEDFKKETIKKLEKEIDSLKSDLNAHRIANNDLEGIVSIKTEKTFLGGKIKLLNDDYSKIIDKYEKILNNNLELKKENKSLDKKIKSLEEQLENNNEIIKSYDYLQWNFDEKKKKLEYEIRKEIQEEIKILEKNTNHFRHKYLSLIVEHEKLIKKSNSLESNLNKFNKILSSCSDKTQLEFKNKLQQNENQKNKKYGFSM